MSTYSKKHVTRLTESAEHRVGKAVPDGELPLCRDNKAESRSEEEVCNEYIVRGDTAPFHETEGQCR